VIHRDIPKESGKIQALPAKICHNTTSFSQSISQTGKGKGKGKGTGKGKGKGKAVPLQAWSGREGSRKLRFPDYMTTAQDGGKVASLRHRPPLPPGNAPGTHSC
jgi:hypothetical protein